MNSEDSSFDPNQLDLPAHELFTYYLLGAITSGPFILITLPALWFRYSTLKYSFEDSGLRMNVGVLFRRESVTAYRRIQDIHVSSNVIQRWLGISTISIQTASGSATPEIVIEGVKEPEKLRDWLYERLRGAKGEKPRKASSPAIASTDLNELAAGGADETTRLLTSIRDNLAEMLRKQESQS
jgi:uncharacterized membrane protein YdbT with pleckstrin-like domain